MGELEASKHRIPGKESDAANIEAYSDMNTSGSKEEMAQSNKQDEEDDDLGQINCETYSIADDSDDSMDTTAVDAVVGARFISDDAPHQTNSATGEPNQDSNDEPTPALSNGDEKDTVNFAVFLVKVYQEHNPQKVPEVPALLAKYAGKEEQLCEAVRKKYLTNSTGNTSDSAPAPEKRPEGESEKPDYHALITEVYEQKHPPKVADVPNLLVKYAGKERELYLRICEKYDFTPDPLAVAATSALEQKTDDSTGATLEGSGQRTDPIIQRQLDEARQERVEAIKERDSAQQMIDELQNALGEAVKERDAAQQTARQLEKTLCEADQRVALAEEERDVVRKKMEGLRQQFQQN